MKQINAKNKLALLVVALTALPLAAQAAETKQEKTTATAQNPCAAKSAKKAGENPCAPKKKKASNPCAPSNPCAAKK